MGDTLLAARAYASAERPDAFHGIFQRFAAVAKAASQRCAVMIDGQEISYQALLERVHGCALGLYEVGVRRGDPVALLLPNGLDFIVASLATFAIGGVLLPLNPRFRDDEIQHCLESATPKAIYHTPALAPLLDGIPAAAVPRFTAANAEVVPDLPWLPDRSAGSPDDAAVYMFSSGSTGKSKRVTRTVGQIVREYEALAATVALSSADVILCTVPLYHAHGFGNAFMAALLSGGRLVLLSQEFNARAVLRTLEEQQVTILPAVPFMYKILGETRLSREPDLGPLRLLISAGAALPREVAERFYQVYGKPIGQLYGSTETGAICLNYQTPHDKPQSVGRPLAGVEVTIRGENGQTLGPNDTGEIWIRSPAMTRQYDHLPEQTAQAFAQDQFFAGDLGYLDADGDLFITGRKKLLVNVAGNKVDPLEVERIVLQHPAVAEAVVIGVEHAGYGELLKAVVVVHEGCSSTAAELIAHAASRLAEYKVPKEVEFRTAIPKSPLGKVLRKYL